MYYYVFSELERVGKVFTSTEPPASYKVLKYIQLDCLHFFVHVLLFMFGRMCFSLVSMTVRHWLVVLLGLYVLCLVLDWFVLLFLCIAHQLHLCISDPHFLFHIHSFIFFFSLLIPDYPCLKWNTGLMILQDCWLWFLKLKIILKKM